MFWIPTYHQYSEQKYFQKDYDSSKKKGTSVLNPGAGFLRIFTVAFDGLF